MRIASCLISTFFAACQISLTAGRGQTDSPAAGASEAWNSVACCCSSWPPSACSGSGCSSIRHSGRPSSLPMERRLRLTSLAAKLNRQLTIHRTWCSRQIRIPPSGSCWDRTRTDWATSWWSISTAWELRLKEPSWFSTAETTGNSAPWKIVMAISATSACNRLPRVVKSAWSLRVHRPPGPPPVRVSSRGCWSVTC